MKAKKIMAFLLVLIMLIGVVGCGGEPAAEDTSSEEVEASSETAETTEAAETTVEEEPKILRYANNYPEMVMLDVHLHTTTDVIQAAKPMAESLLRVDEEGVVQPLLVEALPEMSEDGTEFIFKLKEGIVFHDGTELKASDVGFTLNRIFDPAVGNVNTWLCDMILGGKAMLAGEVNTLAGFEQIDDYTFKISLEGP